MLGTNGDGGGFEGPAARLEGKELPGGWKVLEKVNRSENATGGLLSIGYKVEGGDGRIAYMKAHDYSEPLRRGGPNMTRVLKAMLQAFLLEKDLNEHCADARMSRVTRVLAAEGIHTEESELPVDYLIFELAEGDVRHRLGDFEENDLAWKLRTCHHIAVGVDQLHSAEVFHQDLKPSNILVFTDGSKVGDLGSAWFRNQVSPLVDPSYSGDKDYAPPECQYHFEIPDVKARLRARDLYMFGGVVLFMFCQTDATAALQRKVPDKHDYESGASFEDALPHLIEATEQIAEDLEDTMGSDPKLREVADRYRELCHPDPRLRGHPTAKKRGGDRYALNRYISFFDHLARLAEGGSLSLE